MLDGAPTHIVSGLLEHLIRVDLPAIQITLLQEMKRCLGLFDSARNDIGGDRLPDERVCLLGTVLDAIQQFYVGRIGRVFQENAEAAPHLVEGLCVLAIRPNRSVSAIDPGVLCFRRPLEFVPQVVQAHRHRACAIAIQQVDEPSLSVVLDASCLAQDSKLFNESPGNAFVFRAAEEIEDAHGFRICPNRRALAVLYSFHPPPSVV